MFTQQYKKQLTIRVQKCSVTEQTEVFKMIKDSCAFTQNNNGVFINMSSIDDETIGKIDQFVIFCTQNQTDFDEHDRKINDIKLSAGSSTTSSTCLQNVLSNPDTQENDWQKLVTESKYVERVQKFTKMLTMTSTTVVKRTNSMFTNSCKKFARKAVASTKKNEQDFVNNLTTEAHE